MPKITCPYCKIESASKFIHKAHLRNEHSALFNKNINTSITGAQCELVEELDRTVGGAVVGLVETEVQTEVSINSDNNGMPVPPSEYEIEKVLRVSESENKITIDAIIMGTSIRLVFPASSMLVVKLGGSSDT